MPLAAFWVFDLSQQNKTWNITFANERAYMIDLVARSNRRMRRTDSSPATQTRPGHLMQR